MSRYPDWICDPCGFKYGAWYASGEYVGPSRHCATYHYGTCQICNDENVSVTEPRDFGHLLDWDVVQKEIRERSNISKKHRETRKKDNF